MQTVRPASNTLFCKPDQAETITKSGFFLTEDTVEKPRTAKVINVGSQVKDYEAGDRVIYKPYSTTDIKLNDEEFFLIGVEDVLGVVVDVAE